MLGTNHTWGRLAFDSNRMGTRAWQQLLLEVLPPPDLDPGGHSFTPSVKKKVILAFQKVNNF
jgi:hypothetical protein